MKKRDRAAQGVCHSGARIHTQAGIVFEGSVGDRLIAAARAGIVFDGRI